MTNSEIKSKKEHKKVKFDIKRYALYNLITFLIPFYPTFYLLYYYPNIMHFINLESLFGLTSVSIMGIYDFWLWFFYPSYLILISFIFINSVIAFTSMMRKHFDKKSPPIQGLFKREFDSESKDASDPRIVYYHIRGFIIKWPLWLAYKSPFPWLATKVLKKIGHNKIDKSVILLECYPSLEFMTMEKGVVAYPGSMSSGHVVDSIFGNLSISSVEIKENVMLYPNSTIAPGAILDNAYVLMPNSFSIKDWRGKENYKFYNKTPARPLDSHYSGILSVLPKQIEEIYSSKRMVKGSEIDSILERV
jgi:hypothetical protein